jgi:hypothetical protein
MKCLSSVVYDPDHFVLSLSWSYPWSCRACSLLSFSPSHVSRDTKLRNDPDGARSKARIATSWSCRPSPQSLGDQRNQKSIVVFFFTAAGSRPDAFSFFFFHTSQTEPGRSRPPPKNRRQKIINTSANRRPDAAAGGIIRRGFLSRIRRYPIRRRLAIGFV